MTKSKRKSSTNPLDKIQEIAPTNPSTPVTGRGRRRPNFNTPTDQINTADLQSITSQKPAAPKDTRKAGKYKREAITLPPEQVDLIKQLAAENNMSKLAFYRWLLDLALQQYEDGERPSLEQFIRSGEATKDHWSSNKDP